MYATIAERREMFGIQPGSLANFNEAFRNFTVPSKIEFIDGSVILLNTKAAAYTAINYALCNKLLVESVSHWHLIVVRKVISL